MEEPSQHHAWVHPAKARYYQVHLDRDLFGHWTLRKVWGGIDSSRGRMHNTGIPSYDDGIEQIREIAKRRGQHGYQRIFLPPIRQSSDTEASSQSAGA
jgi:hypothetical protein